MLLMDVESLCGLAPKLAGFKEHGFHCLPQALSHRTNLQCQQPAERMRARKKPAGIACAVSGKANRKSERRETSSTALTDYPRSPDSGLVPSLRNHNE
jgi:hypothetical protein